MARTKGSPKTGGRTKGTPNKNTVELKNDILWLQGKGMELIKKYMNDPDVLDILKLKLYLEIGPKQTKFILPIQTETSVSLDEETLKAIKEAQEKVNDLFK